jgi:Sensors of blue-light using FAD
METYARIVQDELHHDVQVLREGPLASRRFEGWSMRLECITTAICWTGSVWRRLTRSGTRTCSSG